MQAVSSQALLSAPRGAQSSAHSRADVYLVQFAACHGERCLGCLCSQHLCTLLLLCSCHLSLEVLETNQLTFSRRMEGGRAAGVKLLTVARVCMFQQEAFMTKLPVGHILRLQSSSKIKQDASGLSRHGIQKTKVSAWSFSRS